MFTKSKISKILKEAQAGNLEYIKKTLNPNDFHWSNIKYDKTGDTILHCCARLGYVDILQYLLETFTPNAVNIKNNDNKTALHEAAQFGQYLSCNLLLKNGADVDALKKADWTPLMLACTKIDENTSLNNYKCVGILLENKAVVNYVNKDGWSALHLICREGNRDILNFLLKHYLNVKLKTKNGRTALHVACLHGHLEIVDILLQLGLNINEKDQCGNTPFHEAILGQNIQICNFLITKNADIYARNNTDFSILHLAASQNNLDVLKYVLHSLKFDVNLQNKDGFTALHCAARKKLTKNYDFLVQNGAVSIKDNFNRLPNDYLL